jgi:hypothetical protein
MPSGELTPNYIQIKYDAGRKPSVRKGSWVLDDTILGGIPPQGFFYRVVNATDLPNNTVGLELQTNLRGLVGGDTRGSVVIMENVAEVFERGTN